MPKSPPLTQNPALPRRILYVDHTAQLGGGEIALLHLVQHLDRARFTPVVLLSADGPLREKLADAGVEVHLRPLSVEVLATRKDALGLPTLLRLRDAGRAALYILALAWFVRALRVDLVHTNSLKADILGGAAARLARVPLLWHIRDRIDGDYLPAPVVRLFRRLCRWVPDYVIANSQSTLETLALPTPAHSAAVYSGIDIDARSRVVHDGVQRLPIPASPGLSSLETTVTPLIGLVGRISPWKGQHIFLQAAVLVRERFPDARFQIVGAALFEEQDYEAQIHALTRTLGLEECVEFLGFRADVPRLIAEFDVLVHASTSAEPFGQVIVEGMAAGKPVVATDGGGAREIVVNGETGILVPMGEADAMAEAILFLLDYPEIAHTLGQRGHQRACELFSIERTVRKIEAVYDQMLL